MGRGNSKEGLEDIRAVDVEKRKENKRTIKAGFKISLDRIRKSFQYDIPVGEDDNEMSNVDDHLDEEEEKALRRIRDKIKGKLISEINSLHAQTFGAAGVFLQVQYTYS
jgi:hypothetical protein